MLITEELAKAPIYAASIRKALADAEYPAADEAILSIAAEVLASHAGDLNSAIRPACDPAPSLVAFQADGMLRTYRQAIVEIGRPDLIAERLILWAGDHEAAAARHEEAAKDYADMAAQRRGHGNDDQTAADLDARSGAASRSAVTCRELAAAHRDRAARVLRKEAA